MFINITLLNIFISRNENLSRHLKKKQDIGVETQMASL